MSKPRQFAIGDKVRLTSKFLRSTGQYTGREPFSVWTVTGFSGPWLITDEPLDADYVKSAWSQSELAEDPTLAFRRIAPANVQLVKR